MEQMKNLKEAYGIDNSRVGLPSGIHDGINIAVEEVETPVERPDKNATP